MAQIRTWCFIIITILTTLVIFSEENEAKRTHFYTRLSQDLRYLAQTDFELLTQLKSFKGNLAHGQLSSRLLSIVDTYVDSFSNSTTCRDRIGLNSKEHVEEILRNPLAAFTVIYRFVSFFRSLDSLDNLSNEDAIANLPPIITKVKNEFGSNSSNLRRDLADAARAILKIQFTYNLKATDLMQGNLHGIWTRTKLQASHCFYIGLTAKLLKKYTLAIDWLVEAKRLTADVPTATTELMEMIKLHNMQLLQENFINPYFFMKPLKSLGFSDEHVTTPSVREILQNKYAGQGRNASFWPVNVWSLCLGQNLNTPEAASHLFCWQEFKVNKAFTIGPLKMEFLSRNPDIVQIHNAFSNAEVRQVRASKLFPGDIGSKNERRLEQKVEILTGLVQRKSQSVSDLTQVVNHFPGGHTDANLDPPVESDDAGDDMATLMINLNNVEKGGSTVFPAALATTTVLSQGSAVLWFNLFSDGTADMSTTLADCPVIWGRKTTANKWVKYYDQYNARKCLLRPKERFRVLVNGKILPVPRALRHENIEQEELENAKPLSLAEESAPLYSTAEVPVMKYAQAPSSNLQALLQLEWKIFQKVKRILPPLMTQSGKLGQAQSLLIRYLQDFNETAYNSILLKTSGTDTNEAVSQLSWNPLAVYRTFWRFENYIKEFLRLPPGDYGKLAEIRDYIGKVYNESDGPLRRDLEDTMSGILIAQFVHDLKSQDIARGIMSDIDTGIVLSAKQCMEMGQQAIIKGHFYQAIEWMQTALAKVLLQNCTTLSATEADIQLQTAKKVHDKLLGKLAKTWQTFYTEPVSGHHNLTHMRTRKETLYNTYKLRTEREFTDLNLDGLCQGKVHQTIHERSKLFCWYEGQIHPYFRIKPLQVELLSMHPKTEVVVYHNVLSQRLLASLRTDTRRNYSVCSTLPGGETNSNRCVAASAMVHKNESEDALNILRLTSMVTGLNTLRRGIMVHSYTPGGHNAAHADANGYEEHEGNPEANGVATLMFYGMEPQKGGMTAYAQAGIQIPATAGSAAFWYNTLSSGELDTMSYHAGCPVIFGLKRVGTVLMSYVYQNHLKCSANPVRRMEVLVNGKSKYGYD